MLRQNRRFKSADLDLSLRRFKPRLETLEDRTLLTASVYIPDLSARSWMSAELQRLISQPASSGYDGNWIVGVHQNQDAHQLSIAAGTSGFSATGIIENAFQWTFSDDLSPTVISSWLQSRVNTGQIDFYYPLLAHEYQPRFIPNDPLFNSQWHLLNTGQGGGQPGIDMNVVNVWDTYQGQNVQIAVLDTGVTLLHPDLQPNFWVNPGELNNGLDDDGNGLVDDLYGWDFNDSDNDPTPLFDDHGTAVAGVAAGRGNNNVGISGVAPLAQIMGIRLIEGGISDATMAAALSFHSDITDIYSNSWGPTDDGASAFGPGPLLLAAMADNYVNGRGGLGSIYVWAGGNGDFFGPNRDNSNYDGFANSRYAIGVAAVANDGIHSFYSERGANILISAPSDGGSLGITTTAGTNVPGYTNSFGGTSSATPAVSGVIALMLEARPDLTARDVQHILAETARQVDPTDPGWSRNNGGTGYWINDKYGFGMIDAEAAVNAAINWQHVDPQISATSGTIFSGLTIPDADPTGITVTFNATEDMILEHVEFTVDVSHTWRGDLKYILTSPSGTVSVVEPRPSDSIDDLSNWKFMTVRNWGESPVGTWTLQIIDTVGLDEGVLNSFSLDFYGEILATPPVATNDNYFINEDNPLFVNAPGVLGNDAFATSAQLISNVSHGTLFFNPSGSFTYLPDLNFFGSDSFTYMATNSFGTSMATVNINIASVNDAPTAINDGIYITRPGRLFTLNAPGLLSNDFDVDTPFGNLTASLLSAPNYGTLNLSANGSFTFLPTLASGLDSFQYRTYDGQGFSAPATVNLRLNTPPVVQSANVFTEIGVPLSGNALSGATDFDNDVFTANLVSSTTNGVLNLSPNGSYTYTPNPGFFGIDSFTFRGNDPYFNLSNPDQIGNLGTVTIRVDRRPTTVPDDFTILRNNILELFYPGILQNDYDVDTPLFGDVLKAHLVSSPSNGTLTFAENGYIKYVPNPGFVGIDSFTYRSFDGMLTGNLSTVTITVQDTPHALDDSYTTFQPTLNVLAPGVLANDSTPNAGPLTALLLSQPLNGTAQLNPDGSFTYTAFNGFIGVDSFSYRVSDGVGFSEPATVTISVFSLNRAPVANNDAYSLPSDINFFQSAPGVLLNDSDPDGNLLTASLVVGPLNGSLFLNPNGSFSYTPLPGFQGTDSFTYRASDGIALSNIATVTLTVGSPPPPPSNPARRIILGQDNGGELKVMTGETGQVIFTLNPYGTSFTGGVRVATGDLNGDGIPDIITAPGPHTGSGEVPGIRVFDGVTGNQFSGILGTGILPFAPTYRGGINVAVGDLNKDGTLDLLAGADANPGSSQPWFRSYNGINGAQFAGWRGGFTPFTGGVRVASGDVNGDGRDDIIVSRGSTTPVVQVYNPAASTATAGRLRSFNAYTTMPAGGVFVAVGDLDGDGKADIITGAAANANGQVRIFYGNTSKPTRNLTIANTTGPARVAVGDINGDGVLDIVVGIANSNTSLNSRARIYDATTLLEMFGTSDFNYGNDFKGGLFTAALAKKGLVVPPPF
ncbi:MAG: tandem-95 repeat protein [Planctomycetia bacterium]|nr:tandem-95 repeat protein [Planctomycetia bacterium]